MLDIVPSNLFNRHFFVRHDFLMALSPDVKGFIYLEISESFFSRSTAHLKRILLSRQNRWAMFNSTASNTSCWSLYVYNIAHTSYFATHLTKKKTNSWVESNSISKYKSSLTSQRQTWPLSRITRWQGQMANYIP